MLSFEIFTALEAIRNKRRGQNIQEIYNNLSETLSSEEDKRLLQRFFKQEPFSEEEKAAFLGDLLQKVPNANLELYNPAIYLALLPYVKLMYSAEKNGIAEEHAYKLAVVFEDEKKALAYIEAYLKSHPEIKPLMHDACNFALPQESFDLKTWQKLCAKFLLEDPFRKLILPQAPVLEKLIKSSQKKTKPNAETVKKATLEVEKINSIFRKLEKKHGEIAESKKSKELVKLLAEMEKMLIELGVPDVAKKDDEEQYQELLKQLFFKRLALAELGVPFNDQLSYTMLQAFREKYVNEASQAYGYFLNHGLTDKDYGKFTALARQDDEARIPNIKIDGKALGHPGYYLMKVPVVDEMHAARAACLGKLTNCCQSLSGEAGESCAIHGLTSPHAGFYVVCKGDVNNPQITDELLGQCWAWRSKSNAIVFDSIEVAEEKPATESDQQTEIKKEDKSIKTISIDMFRKLGKELVLNGHTDKVASGFQSGISGEVGISSELNQLEEFIDYDGYCDSTEQRVIYDKNKPFYWYSTDERSTQDTESLIIQALSSSEPLSKSPAFIATLNWAFSNPENGSELRRKVLDIAQKDFPGRVPELTKTTEIISSFLRKNIYKIEGMPEEKNNYSVNQLEGALLEIVQYHGTPLLTAAAEGNLEDILLLLEKGANIHAKNSKGQTALMIAADRGNTEIIEALLENGALLNAVDSAGKTALMHAFESKKRKQTVRLLLDRGAEFNTVDRAGFTPLMFALKHFWSELALELIEKDIAVNPRQIFQNPPLIWAVEVGDTQSALKLIEKGANIHFKDLRDKTTILQKVIDNEVLALAVLARGGDAMQSGKNGPTLLFDTSSPKVAAELLLKGVDIEAKDADGRTALNRAIERYQYDLALFLIEKGANVNVVSKEKYSPLMGAIASNSVNMHVIQALLAKGADVNEIHKDETLLMRAQSVEVVQALIKHGADVNVKTKKGTVLSNLNPNAKPLAKVVQELIKAGADINGQDEKGKTMLIQIAESPQSRTYNAEAIEARKELFQTIIANGADINLKDKEGRPALCYSLQNGRTEESLMLLSKGATLDFVSEYGDSPLYIAIDKYDTRVALKLIEMGADTNIKNRRGLTPLMRAAISGEGIVFQALLDKKADIQAIDNEGNTVLHHRINYLDEVPENLLKTKIKVNAVNKEGKTALMKTAERGLFKFAQALIEHGAEVNVKDKQGRTPLMMAIDNENLPLVKLIIQNRANVNALTNNGDSVLMFALRKGDADVIQALLQKGAMLNLPKEEGYQSLLAKNSHLESTLSTKTTAPLETVNTSTRAAPLTFMTRVQQPPTVSSLPIEGDLTEKFKEAVKKDDPKKLLALMERAGWEIDKFILDDDGNQCSLLMHACEEGAVNVVQILLRHGATVNLEDEEGDTALTYAADCEAETQKYIIKLLIDNKASLSHQNKAGETAFDRVQEGEESEDESENELSDMDAVSELGDSDNEEEDEDIEEVTELLALLDPAQEKEKQTESKRRAPVIFTQENEKQAEKGVSLVEEQHLAKKIKPQ